MLSHDELLQLCQRLGLSPQAWAVIDEIRSSPPSRHVRGAAGNVCVRYPSRKMGVTIQAESHRNELVGIYEKEHDPDTLEYYDQPPAIKLVYLARNGRRVGVLHTPDYFVIRTDSVGWEEWKLEEELVRLAEQMPHRYQREEGGRWRCPPGEQYAEALGLFYHVRSSAGIDWVFQRNLLFLEDYLRADCAVNQQALHAAVSLVSGSPGLTLAELLQGEHGASGDEIYAMIATERLYVDVRAAPLAEPERVRVFRDEEIARAYALIAGAAGHAPAHETPWTAIAAGSAVVWDRRPWMVVNVGETATALLAEDGEVVELPHNAFEALVRQGKLVVRGGEESRGLRTEVRELLSQASPDDFREANRRYAVIAPRLRPVLRRAPSYSPDRRSVQSAAMQRSDGGTGSSPLLEGVGKPGAASTPARTVRDWLSRWRRAEQRFGCGYVGLLPRRHQSGNRLPKLPEGTLAAIETFIAEEYETLK